MTQSPFLGIISGERRRSHTQVAERAGRIAGGLQQLGVGQGDSVCILMRNDIAFIEAAYAVMLLGAYAVPVNWHFKPEEITYVLQDVSDFLRFEMPVDRHRISAELHHRIGRLDKGDVVAHQDADAVALLNAEP